VEGVKYASTVVNAVRASNVEGVKHASTVVDAVGASNVEGDQYAITVVYAVSARNAKGVKNEANGTEAQTSHQGLVGYILKTHVKRKERQDILYAFKKCYSSMYCSIPGSFVGRSCTHSRTWFPDKLCSNSTPEYIIVKDSLHEWRLRVQCCRRSQQNRAANTLTTEPVVLHPIP